MFPRVIGDRTATADSGIDYHRPEDELDLAVVDRPTAARRPFRRPPAMSSELADQVAAARARIPLQHTAELYEAMDDRE
ncbi:hypothetical protein V9085_10465, partial [Streptococcus agalactiae]|uniref:hypothetical protein n=1 Tax=Streptococcus agalactiae TaxID=1311 RepID=UPI00300FC2D1